MTDHAEHFDPDCEECAYLARPTRETLTLGPDTGAEERLRAALDADVLARAATNVDENVDLLPLGNVWWHAVAAEYDRLLSSGSVDEERDSQRLHETHVCRDCGAEITIPFDVPLTPESQAVVDKARARFWCDACKHQWARHTVGGMCDGGGTECWCVLSPPTGLER